jgi:hypothetical protein
MIDLWDVLTGADAEPDEKLTPDEHAQWKKHQQKLNGLLTLITGSSPLSIIEMNPDKNATELFNLLKAEYNTLTLTTFSILYRKIFRCSLANHKTLREYFDEVVRARNKLKELGDPISEMAVTSCFLDGLDTTYDDWKNVYMATNARSALVLATTTKGDGKTTPPTGPTVEDVMRQLADRESRLFNDTNKKDHARAFGAKPPRSQSSNQGKGSRGASSKKDQSGDSQPLIKCTNCHSSKHVEAQCWFKFPSMAMDYFHKLYPTQKDRDEGRDEMRRTVTEWERTYPKKGMVTKPTIRAAITASGGSKDDQWYMDTAAAVHITHDLTLFMSELDSRVESIETATGEKIQTRGAGIINVDVILDSNEHTNVHLHDVHYCPEVDSNLLSLGVLEEKGHTFNAKNSVLRVLDSDEDVVLVANRQRNVYVLHQPIESNQYSLSPIFSIKPKPASMETWHQRAGHVNLKDLIQLPLIATDVKSLIQTTPHHFVRPVCLISNTESITPARPPIDQKSLRNAFIRTSSGGATPYLLLGGINMEP